MDISVATAPGGQVQVDGGSGPRRPEDFWYPGPCNHGCHVLSLSGFSYLTTSLLARGQRASQLTAPCPARPCEQRPAPITAAAPRSAEQPCLWLPFLLVVTDSRSREGTLTLAPSPSQKHCPCLLSRGRREDAAPLVTPLWTAAAGGPQLSPHHMLTPPPTTTGAGAAAAVAHCLEKRWPAAVQQQLRVEQSQYTPLPLAPGLRRRGCSAL